MNDAKARAAQTLDHYITSVMQKAGMHVTQDTHVEIAGIVDNIIDAACNEASDRMLRELRNQTRR